jgi:predicted nucleic acid-binding protein
VSLYLDANVLVALFIEDPLTDRVEAFLRSRSRRLIVSDFAAAEFASAIARRVRMGQIAPDGAREAYSNFDAWSARGADHANITSADVASATAFLRRLDIALRAPDAIHIAASQRVEADLLTYDSQLAASARMLGSTVLPEDL